MFNEAQSKSGYFFNFNFSAIKEIKGCWFFFFLLVAMTDSQFAFLHFSTECCAGGISSWVPLWQHHQHSAGKENPRVWAQEFTVWKHSEIQSAGNKAFPGQSHSRVPSHVWPGCSAVPVQKQRDGNHCSQIHSLSQFPFPSLLLSAQCIILEKKGFT